MTKHFLWMPLTIVLSGVLFGLALAVTLTIPGPVVAARAQAAAQDQAATVVVYNGTSFAPSIVTIDTAWKIEVRNDTSQNLSLTITSGLPAQAQTPRVFLPLLSRSRADAAAATAPTAPDALLVDLPARGSVQLTMAGRGNWTVAVAGKGAALAVYVVTMPTPTPTPTSTPTPTPTPTPNQQEWSFHKSSDGAHPNGAEQQMLWLMNRARANPGQEGAWLATTPLEDIASPREYFEVNTTKLQNEFNGYSVKAPAAFDVRLYDAARAHSDDLIARDAQDHDGQFERVDDAGFDCAGGRGNVFSYAESALNGHAAFNIDWGYESDGMQSGRGHRKAIMSLDGNYTNVGIAMVAESNASTEVGPLVTTGNYCNAGSGANHYNRFIVGTVWADSDGDSLYDAGEGIAGVRVAPDRGGFYAVTGNAGGYAIPITATGEYNVSFDLDGGITRRVTVGSNSVLLDVLHTAAAAHETTPAGTVTATPGVPHAPGEPLFIAPDEAPAP